MGAAGRRAPARALQPEHVAGLESIVLTDAVSIGKGKTGRVGNRKYRRAECLGFYHARSKRGNAWIELIVDNVVAATPKQLLWFRIFRDFCLGKTLYHEIGHHLEATLGAATRGGEAAADDWCRRLLRIHGRKRYPRLEPLVKALLVLLRLGLRVLRR